MDGWSNNSAYTSGNSSTGGYGNSGSSATSNGYGSSSSDYSSSSSNDSAYWSGVYGNNSSSDAWKNNTAYTAGNAGVFGTEEARQNLIDAAKNKRMTEGQQYTANAMVAGKQAAQGQGVIDSILSSAGTALGGLPGGVVAKGASYAVNKGLDALNEYGESPSYQKSKELSNDDNSLVGTAIGMFAPAGLGGVAKTAYNDQAGNYNQQINTLNKAMIENGYTKTPASAPQVSSGSSNSNSLLSNMLKTQQQTTTQSDASSNAPASLDWGTFNFYSGSAV